ncbi:MAG TPA: hypothetical protein VMS31_13415 [Pyrinomonadaceae bacterium]|nr:hypothetical protein [Pyrinomonadaceae bacterium]
MTKINWTRLIVGALIAAIIAFLSDGFLHDQLLKADWKAIYESLGAREPAPHGTSMAYFAVFELGRGLISIFVYVLMRAHWKPGPKTAALAGVVAWIAFSVTGPAQFIPLGFFSNVLWGKVMAFQLVTSILAAIAGAAVYKGGETSAVAS